MKPGYRIVLKFLIPTLLFLMVTGFSAVAKEGDPMAEGRERHLNGHGFLPSIYVGDPFVSSYFANYTGGGMAMNLETVFRDLDGTELYTFEGNLLFAALGMGYQQKLGTKWAVGAFFTAQIKSGTNAESFLTRGADVGRQGSLWVMYRLKRTEKSQLSVGLDWSYANTLYFTPYDFAVDIANGVPVDEASLLLKDKVWTSRITANWARGFSSAWGLRVNGELGLYEVPGSWG